MSRDLHPRRGAAEISTAFRARSVKLSVNFCHGVPLLLGKTHAADYADRADVARD